MMLLWACAAGILAGLRCTVFVLLPLSIILAGIVVAVAWSSGAALHLTDIALPVVACQAGYMLGLTARDTLATLILRRVTRSNRA